MGSAEIHRPAALATSIACRVALRAGSAIRLIESSTEQHVGARVAVEHELALAIGAERHEGERGAGLGREPGRAAIDAGSGLGLGQEMAERIAADLAHEGARRAEAGEADRDVGRRAAGRLLERRGFDQAGPADGRYEVDQQLAETDDIGHRASLMLPPRGPQRARRRQRPKPTSDPVNLA